MRAVFGHPFSLLWFSPFSTPDHGKAETYQYVVWELSAGNEAAGSEPKWEAQPSPTEPSYGILLLLMLNMIYTVSPKLAMDSFSSAFCVAILSALYIHFFLASSESSCREKFVNPVCKHCDESIFSDLLLFLLLYQKPSFILLCLFLLSLEGSFQLNYKKKIIFYHLFLVLSGNTDSFGFRCWSVEIYAPEISIAIPRQWTRIEFPLGLQFMTVLVVD